MKAVEEIRNAFTAWALHDIKTIDELHRRVIDIIQKRDAEQRREMKELAHRLLTEVEGRVATIEVRKDGANSNEISVEESLKHLQFVRKHLEALASTKEEGTR